MGSRRRPFLTTALSSRLKKIQVEAELRASKKKHPSQVGDFLASFLLLSLLVPLSLPPLSSTLLVFGYSGYLNAPERT